MAEEKKITLEEILIWIINNHNNRDSMDKISVTTFPYTTKYANTYQNQQRKEGGVY